MRSDILASAVLCDVDDVVKEAKAKFNSWMAKNAHIPPNLREVVYTAGTLSNQDSRYPSWLTVLCSIISAYNKEIVNKMYTFKS